MFVHDTHAHASRDVSPALARSALSDACTVDPGNLSEEGSRQGAAASQLQVLTPRLARRHRVDWVQCAVLELDAWGEECDADELLQFVCRRIALRVVVEAQEGRRTLHGALCSRVVDGVWQEVVVVLVGADRVALELRLALA